MNTLVNLSKRTTAFLAAVLLFVGLSIPVVVPKQTHAAQLTQRSLQISSSANGTIGTAGTEGQGGNGLKAKHTVTFTMATSGATVQSIVIMYCTSPIFQSTCTTPTGLDASHVTSATVSGLTGAGSFSLDTTTADSSLTPAADGVCNGGGSVRTNCVALSAASGQAQTSTPTAIITYGGASGSYVTNPTTDNYSFYARILVFSDLYTTVVDYGGTAASTAQQVDITAKVQEVLNFSVGTTVTSPNGSTCTPFSDTGALALGDPTNGVLSSNQAYDAHSYFRVSTNTLHGTVIYYSGDTLKSGSNSITAIGTSNDVSRVGSNQFGLGLDSSDLQSGSGYSFTNLVADSPYNAGNGTITNLGTAKFAFDTGSTTTPVQIAHSTGGISCDTGSVRYLGNVSTSTPAGIYTTTITYIATGTY